MEDELPTLIQLTQEDMDRVYERIMSQVPYETPGQLRDAVFAGGEFCCSNCHDWSHRYSEAWVELEGWLFLNGDDWREVA